jgi:hypothetical protein
MVTKAGLQKETCQLIMKQLIHVLQGVRHKSLHFTLYNTSVETLPQSLFQQVNWVQNLSIDVRGNSLRSLENPNTGDFPGVANTMFTTDLKLKGNKWTCDCQIG